MKLSTLALLLACAAAAGCGKKNTPTEPIPEVVDPDAEAVAADADAAAAAAELMAETDELEPIAPSGHSEHGEQMDEALGADVPTPMTSAALAACEETLGDTFDGPAPEVDPPSMVSERVQNATDAQRACCQQVAEHFSVSRAPASTWAARDGCCEVLGWPQLRACTSEK